MGAAPSLKAPASGKTVTISHQQGAYSVTEGDSVTVAVSFSTGAGVARPRNDVSVALDYVPGTAMVPGGYSGLVATLTVAAADWGAAGTAFTATKTHLVVTTEDSEQFTVVLDLPPGEPALFAPTCPPGTPDGARCAATVTIIDNETLEVQSVALSSTPTGGYYHGTGTISFTVNFNGAVTVTGTPQFTFDLGGQSRQAAYASGSDSDDLVFSYTP